MSELSWKAQQIRNRVTDRALAMDEFSEERDSIADIEQRRESLRQELDDIKAKKSPTASD